MKINPAGSKSTIKSDISRVMPDGFSQSSSSCYQQVGHSRNFAVAVLRSCTASARCRSDRIATLKALTCTSRLENSRRHLGMPLCNVSSGRLCALKERMQGKSLNALSKPVSVAVCPSPRHHQTRGGNQLNLRPQNRMAAARSIRQ
ncbi:MAG: hypothetical protein ISN29_08995 [Gammaproteobacteria bacterium AqS3]|nr:hypothetical protein [Gammaproteobacteria bacterium AqS3]